MKHYYNSLSNAQKISGLMLLALLAFMAFSGLHAEPLTVAHTILSAGSGGLLMAPAAAATLEDLSAEFTKQTNEMKSLASDLSEAHKELKQKTDGNETISKELKEAIDKLLVNFNGVKGTVEDLEQKMAARVEAEQKTAKTWGEQIGESEAYKGFKAKGGSASRGAFGLEVKQVTSAAAGGLIVSRRETEVVALERERRVIRDLLTTIPVTENSIDYPIQTTRTNNAAPVAEGTAKPYSDYAWSSASVTVRVLAHLAKLTRQAVDDAPRLVGEVDSEMRYGLGYVEERQFLYGSGVGQNLHGIVPQATAFAVNAGYTANALATRVDVLRLAILQVALGLLPADGIVLNPVDWALIEMTKTTDGAYLFANPQGTVNPRMWGLPVISTPAMDADDFLVGNFKGGATVYDRMGVEVLISSENSDDFEKNLVTMRAEERVAIAVKRAYAFVTGDFTTALAAGGGMVPA